MRVRVRVRGAGRKRLSKYGDGDEHGRDFKNWVRGMVGVRGIFRLGSAYKVQITGLQ